MIPNRTLKYHMIYYLKFSAIQLQAFEVQICGTGYYLITAVV